MAKRRRLMKFETCLGSLLPGLGEFMIARATRQAAQLGHQISPSGWQSAKNVWQSKGSVRAWCEKCGRVVHVVPKGVGEKKIPFSTGPALSEVCGRKPGQTPHLTDCLSQLSLIDGEVVE